MNEGTGWLIAFLIALIVILVGIGVIKGAVEENSLLREDLKQMTNNSLIWERTANNNLQILLHYKDRQNENLESNCVMDCYKFQLDWGYSDVNYCTKYCKEKYEH